MRPPLGGAVVWSGNYGTFEIPAEVMEGVRFNKRGLPDGRDKAKAAKFLEWVEQEEKRMADKWCAKLDTP